ncbi:MAG TPA: SDR family NAD(P)-dependent oxidoreductase [Caulobacteraceae bacterium]
MAPADPVVLITGASSGLGEAFARAYAALGRDLVLVARRLDRLEALGAELQAAHGVKVMSLRADLSVFGAEATVLQAVANHGFTIDVLVNNAGFSIPQSFAAVPWAAQRDFLMTLVVSACGLAHGVLPGMIERGNGSIINVASLAGFAPGAAGHTLYPGAKSLAIKFSEALDAEYRAAGVRVTAVCPGFTATEFAKANGTQAIMDASPRFFFQTAEQVVFTAIRANARGRVVCVPGWHNKLAAGLLRYLPQSLVRAVIQAGSAKYHLDT